MRALMILLVIPFFSRAAEDAWAKLREVKSGAELRVFKIGSPTPLIVKMGELTDENLVIIDKNKQTAIARDQIDKVEARLTPVKRTVTRETKTTDNSNDPRNVIPGPTQQLGVKGANTTTSSSTTFTTDKPPFETVYRRATGAPKKD